MGWCGFDPLPGGRVLRTLVGATDFPNPTGPTNLVPPLSIKLSSARHRRAALSLCYGGMAEPGRMNDWPCGHCDLANRLRSRPQQVPTGGRRLVPTRKPFGSIPFRTEAQGRLGSPSLCLNAVGWRSVISIEPSASAGRPMLQTRAFQIPRRSRPRPAGRIAFRHRTSGSGLEPEPTRITVSLPCQSGPPGIGAS